MIFVCRDGLESHDVEVIILQQEGTGNAPQEMQEIIEEHPKVMLKMSIMGDTRWNQLAIDFNASDKEAYVELTDMLGDRSRNADKSFPFIRESAGYRGSVIGYYFGGIF